MKIRRQHLCALCVGMLALSLLSGRSDSNLAQAQDSPQGSAQLSQARPDDANAAPVGESPQTDSTPQTDSQPTASPQGPRGDQPKPSAGKARSAEPHQPNAHQPNADQPNADQPNADRSRPGSSDLAEDHAAALGVLVGPCPGQGVCVLETLPDSPAESVGIEPGDYILAINDQVVSSPGELKQKIEGLNSADTINVSVWRTGQTLTKQVALAAEAKELPSSHRSWLGVMLSGGPDQEAGITIRRVLRRGPAAQAGLRAGDRVTQLNGEQVESIEQFIDLVQNYEPGAKLDLTVQRGEQDVELSAQLGDVRDAPMQWFRQSFRMPMYEEEADSVSGDLFQEEFPASAAPSMGVIEEILDDMRLQIRVLQEQVEELKKPATPAVDSALEGLEQTPVGPTEQDDVSRVDAADSQIIKLVQFDGRRRSPYRSRDDWRGSRYDNRIYRDGYDRYRGGYRSFYGDRGYQGRPYRYYNYGGRPYYYGGSSPYGYRGGIRLGPNFSIWW